jgi:hypothetical protein
VRLDVAEEELETKKLGFEVLGRGPGGPAAKAQWTVCEMRPAPGTHVAQGATIRLVIKRFARPRCRLPRRKRR